MASPPTDRIDPIARSVLPDNQGKCCDAVLQVFESRFGASRRGLRFPEREGHSAPVELVCLIGERRVAIEHTRIEAYSEQIQDGVDFVRALQAIEKELTGKLPEDMFFQLAVPSASFRRLETREVLAIREQIQNWALDRAWSMPRERWRVTETVAGLPVTLIASSWPIRRGEDSLAGRLLIARFAPENVEALRVARLGAALDRKLPKLSQWAPDCITVLVLEDNDIALTNQYLVAGALRQACQGRANMAESAFVVSWYGDVVWIVPLVEGGKFVDDDSLLSARVQIPVAKLTDIFGTAA